MGIVNEDKLRQPEKAKLPILVTLLGIVIDDISVLNSKAQPAIKTTFVSNTAYCYFTRNGHVPRS